MYRIGKEVTKVVRHKPTMLYMKEIIRPKYALKDSTVLPPEGRKGVEIAHMPLVPVNKCIADASCLPKYYNNQAHGELALLTQS